MFTLIGMALVFCISYFNPTNGNGISVNFEHMTAGLGLYLFFAAMIAITAMVLPGISVSTLLLIFGLYVPVINAIHEFMHLNLSYLPVLVIFGLGVLTGIVSIIKIIKICLAKHRSQTIYRFPICHHPGTHNSGCASATYEFFYVPYWIFYPGCCDLSRTGTFKNTP